MIARLTPLWEEDVQRFADQNLVSQEYDNFVQGIISTFSNVETDGKSLCFLPYRTHKCKLSFPEYEFTFCTKNVTNSLFFLNARFLKIQHKNGCVDSGFFWEAPYIASVETKVCFVEFLSQYLSKREPSLTLGWERRSDSLFLTTKLRFSYKDTTASILEQLAKNV